MRGTSTRGHASARLVGRGDRRSSLLLALGATAQAGHLFSDVAGHTTLERVITGADPANGYATLSQPAGRTTRYVVRDGAGEGNPAIPNAQAGPRGPAPLARPTSGQLTDFQLADEESPARVEFTDQEPTGLRGLGLAPAGGAAAVHHRLVDPPDEPVRGREPGGAGRTATARRWTSR